MNLPESGAVAASAKMMGADGKPLRITIDEAGDLVDEAALLANERAIAFARYGKLRKDLYAKAHAAAPDERIWAWIRVRDDVDFGPREEADTPRGLERARTARQTIAQEVGRVEAWLVAHAPEAERGDHGGPILRAQLTPAEIDGVATLDDVVEIGTDDYPGTPQGLPWSSSSQWGPTVRVPEASALSTGAGAKVCIKEDARPDVATSLGLTAIANPSGTASLHPRVTAGIVKNTATNPFLSVAPSASTYIANWSGYSGSVDAWCQSQGVRTLNYSYEVSGTSSGALQAIDMQHDYLAKTSPYMLVVAAAGNVLCSGYPFFVCYPDSYVANRGLSGLVVGGVNDQNTADRSDDTFTGIYKNPATTYNDYELPHVVAPVSASAAGGDLTGSSVATSIVSGIAALVDSRATNLASWPEGRRAIILATSTGRADQGLITSLGGTTYKSTTGEVDGKIGAGEVDAFQAADLAAATNAVAGTGGVTAAKGHLGRSVSFPSDFNGGWLNAKWRTHAYASGRLRVAIAWDSTTNCTGVGGSCTTDTKDADLDLYVYKPTDSTYNLTGSVACHSISFDSTWEICDIPVVAGEEYLVALYSYASSASYTYLGVAWYQYQQPSGAPCVNGTECASGSCYSGKCGCTTDSQCPDRFCSWGWCTTKYAQGASCSASNQCASGSCANGYCCNSACDGPCDACNLTGSLGTCLTAPAGTSPSPWCGGYLCNGTTTSCPTSCASDASCASGYFCNGGSCVVKRGNGVACSAANQCGSGYCVDGYCCNTGCGGACDRCNATPGTCTTAPLGTAGSPACSGNLLCDGVNVACPSTCSSDAMCAGGYYCSGGACTAKRSTGTSCTGSNQCASGNCVDGYCCNTACSGSCDQCNATPGTCTNMPPGSIGQPSCSAYVCSGTSASCPSSCTSDSNCAPGYYCSSAGACVAQRSQGQACNLTNDCKGGSCRECATGNCVDGYCCNAACTNPCDACNVSGALGTCSTAPAGTTPQLSCSGYLCSGTGPSCPSSCTSDANCAAGFYCSSAGVCVAQRAPGQACNLTTDCKAGGACRECATGNCVDGVCCLSACAGACDRCNSTPGTCTLVAAGTAGSPGCSGNLVCDGTSASCPGACASDASCAPGFYCASGTCWAKAGNGGACSAPNQCSSGNCADGYCCNSACTDSCDRCDQPGDEGFCMFADRGSAGQPACPNNFMCAGGSSACPSSCSTDLLCAPGSYCSGGACITKKANGATCAAPHECSSGNCVDGYCCNAACNGPCDQCNATPGTCTNTPSGTPGQPSCVGFLCTGTSSACPTSCTSDSACAAGYFCSAAGACVAQKPQGQTCNLASDCRVSGTCRECSSGNCVDGYCCDSVCNSSCQACSAVKKGAGADGACGAITTGTCGDLLAPTWPTNAAITFTPLTNESVRLSWTPAVHPNAVKGYRVYRDGALQTTVAGTVTTWDATGLTSNTTYTFEIEAFALSSPDTTNGPRKSFTTGTCGDGTWLAPESCDDGPANGGAHCTCSSACTPADVLVADATYFSTPKPPPPILAKSRTLGAGRHPVAIGESRFAIAYVEEDESPPVVSYNSFSLAGVGNAVGVPLSTGTVPALDAAPVLAALPGGKFAAAWNDFDGDGDELGVALQLVDPAVAPTARPTYANQTTAFSQQDPDVVWTGTQLVVAWVDGSNTAHQQDVKYRTFDASLLPTSMELPIAATADAESDVALTAFGGSFAAAYRIGRTDGDWIGVFTGGNTWTFGPFAPGPFGERPAIAALDGHHVLVVFAVGVDGGGYALKAAIVDVTMSGGVVANDVPAAAGGSAQQPSVVALDGKVWLAWRTDGAVSSANGEELVALTTSWVGGGLALDGTPVPVPADPAHQIGDQRSVAVAAGAAIAVGAWDDFGGSLLPADAATADEVVVTARPGGIW